MAEGCAERESKLRRPNPAPFSREPALQKGEIAILKINAKAHRRISREYKFICVGYTIEVKVP